VATPSGPRKRRELPDGTQRRVGADLAARNARRLYRAGARLLVAGSAAPAAPLLAAALEEAVKSLALSLAPDRLDETERDVILVDVLYGPQSHDARLRLARDWYIGVEPGLAIALLVGAAAHWFIGRGEAASEARFMAAYREALPQLAPALSTAWELRARGLYVDWRADGTWTDPGVVSTGEVRELRRVAARFVRAALRASRNEPGGTDSDGPRAPAHVGGPLTDPGATESRDRPIGGADPPQRPCHGLPAVLARQRRPPRPHPVYKNRGFWTRTRTPGTTYVVCLRKGIAADLARRPCTVGATQPRGRLVRLG